MFLVNFANKNENYPIVLTLESFAFFLSQTIREKAQGLHTTPTPHAVLCQFLWLNKLLEILMLLKMPNCKTQCVVNFYKIDN